MPLPIIKWSDKKYDFNPTKNTSVVISVYLYNFHYIIIMLILFFVIFGTVPTYNTISLQSSQKDIIYRNITLLRLVRNSSLVVFSTAICTQYSKMFEYNFLCFDFVQKQEYYINKMIYNLTFTSIFIYLS